MNTDMLKRLGRRIRLGMVGGGFDSVIGETHRIAYQTDGFYDLVAGCFSIDPAVAQETADALLLAPDRSYLSFREMAAREAGREDGIDMVVVATPPQLHKDVALAFLEHGVDVICEKPLARDVAEAEMIRAAVDRSGKMLVTDAHCYSGFPMIRHARDLVRDGALGRVRLVETEFAGGAPGVAVEPQDPAKRHWRFRAGSMGRAAILGEVGTHAYHLASYVTGRLPARVSARLDTLAPGREVYDNAYLTFLYEGGSLGRLWASYVAVGTQHGLALRIYGDKAAIEWREEDAEFLHLRPIDAPEALLRAGQDGVSPFVARSARFRPGHPEGYPLAFANLYAGAAMAFIARETGGNAGEWLQGLPGIDDGVAGMRMIAAAEQSHDDDGEVSMIGIALIGAGRIGQVHARNIVRHSGARLVAVADPMLSSAQAIVGPAGAIAVADPLAAISTTQVDAVVIASPTDTHVATIAVAAEAGKAILCEKPIDLHMPRVDECRAILARYPVPFMLAFNRRFDPSTRCLHEAIQDGRVGQVEHVLIISRDPAPPPHEYIARSGGIFRDADPRLRPDPLPDGRRVHGSARDRSMLV